MSNNTNANGKEVINELKRICLRKKNLTQDSPEILELPTKYPQLFQLNLSNNNLTAFPPCLLKCENLVSLDIRKNNFQNFDDLIKSLAQFKFLSDLKVDFTSSSQVQLLLSQSRQLIYINGKSTKDFISYGDIEDKEIDDISLEKSLPLFNSIFTSFQAKLQTSSQEKSKDFYEKFQAIINEEASNINSINNNIPNYSLANKVLKSEFSILNFFFKNFVGYCDILDDQKEKIGNMILEKYMSSISSLNSLIEKIQPNFDNVISIMRKQMEIFLNFLGDQKNSIELTDKIAMLKKEMNKQLKVYQEENSLLEAKVEKLESENKYMTDKIIKAGLQIEQEFATLGPSKKLSPSLLNTSKILQTQSSVSSNQTSNQFSISGARELPLKVMKDTIKEIYQTKIEYDKKCVENKLPRETMEQHMYNYLNTKYGLKNLVIEWASSIILGIKQYSDIDSDICLFGKILRNEQEEESQLVLEKLKTTVSDLLEMNIKNKNPLKSQSEVQKIVQMKMEKTLNEEEWRSILYSIHQKDEAQAIEQKILKIIKAHNDNKKKHFFDNIPNPTREDLNAYERFTDGLSIKFSEFLHVITEYQIIYRDTYLSNFLKLFQKYDTNKDGKITENEFREMLMTIDVVSDLGEKFIKMLLEKVDPFNHKLISFSSCVTLFSMQMIDDPDMKVKISLLDKMCVGDGDDESESKEEAE